MFSYNNCFHSVWLLLRRLQVNIDSCLFAPSSVIKSIALLRFSDNGCNRRRFDSLTARSCCLCSKATCFQRLNMKHSDVMRFLRMFWQCSKKQQDDYVHALVTWNLVASLVLQINMCAKLIFFLLSDQLSCTKLLVRTVAKFVGAFSKLKWAAYALQLRLGWANKGSGMHPMGRSTCALHPVAMFLVFIMACVLLQVFPWPLAKTEELSCNFNFLLLKLFLSGLTSGCCQDKPTIPSDWYVFIWALHRRCRHVADKVS